MGNTRLILLFLLVHGIFTFHSRRNETDESIKRKSQFKRKGRQIEPPGDGIDFTNAVIDQKTGQKCVIKSEEIESVAKDPILSCVHKNVEKCHYTYITQFTPSQEEVCQENYEKSCRISFNKQAVNQTVRKCYRPVGQVCDGQGKEECRTVYQSSCSTKYVEKQPGKFVGDTACEKLPVEICGAGCAYEEGAEECHEKVITSVVEAPEEVCDLNPQKTCRFVTKLVPRLKPSHQCTIIPQESCTLQFTAPRQVKKPLLTKWCLEESPVKQGESYEESNSLGDPIETSRSLDSVSDSLNSVSDPLTFVSDPLKSVSDPLKSVSDPLQTTSSAGKLFESVHVDLSDIIEDEDDISDIMNPFESKLFENPEKPFFVIPRQELDNQEEEGLEDFDIGIEVEDFRTIIDDTFPYQDFSDFQYVEY